MDNSVEINEVQFANGQNSRDLRGGSDAEVPETQVEAEDLREDSGLSDGFEALRNDSGAELGRRIELRDRDGAKYGTSGGSPWFRRISRRALLLVLLVLAISAVSPVVWNYLQSFESTDDAQIDGHIDPLSSRINGTVIRVHAE